MVVGCERGGGGDPKTATHGHVTHIVARRTRRSGPERRPREHKSDPRGAKGAPPMPTEGRRGHQSDPRDAQRKTKGVQEARGGRQSEPGRRPERRRRPPKGALGSQRDSSATRQGANPSVLTLLISRTGARVLKRRPPGHRACAQDSTARKRGVLDDGREGLENDPSEPPRLRIKMDMVRSTSTSKEHF